MKIPESIREMAGVGHAWQYRLGQADIWVGSDGRVRRLAEMEERHLINCEAFLLRHAERIRDAVCYYDFCVQSALGIPEDVPLLIEKIGDLDPQQWMRTTPVFQGIYAELERRGRTR